MKITRNTMRADGLTVGESMDLDAAFLRSIGIPALDGQPTNDERREAFNERVRNAILSGLDKEFDSDGWNDAELGVLFKAADEHTASLWNRLNDKQRAAP